MQCYGSVNLRWVGKKDSQHDSELRQPLRRVGFCSPICSHQSSNLTSSGHPNHQWVGLRAMLEKHMKQPLILTRVVPMFLSHLSGAYFHPQKLRSSFFLIGFHSSSADVHLRKVLEFRLEDILFQHILLAWFGVTSRDLQPPFQDRMVNPYSQWANGYQTGPFPEISPPFNQKPLPHIPRCPPHLPVAIQPRPATGAPRGSFGPSALGSPGGAAQPPEFWVCEIHCHIWYICM